MQWRKLARSKITSGRSRTRNMLCCGRRKENGREVPDITASPGRAPPVPASRPRDPPPMVIQGDFRKVSGISTEIFRQIEQVENDHDATTAAALEAVDRRGEMIVRVLEPRQLGRTASEAAKRFLNLQDAKHTVQFVEIVKRPGQTLGLYIREGNGIDRNDGVFISRIALESAVYNSGCLKVGDEILAVNLVDVTRMSLDDVVIIMSIPRRLVLATRQRKGSKGGAGSPSLQPRSEHKPPPVVVIKRELRDDENDELDDGHSNRESMRHQRHTGDGREMSESRSRLGLGLTGFDSRHTTPQDSTNGLVDLYYNSRPPDSGSNTWGYQPPPPVITEQPKSSIQHFQPYERGYPKTLESLAEKVHPFYTGPVMPTNGRRMSAGGQPLRSSGQGGPASHYYVQHGPTGSRRLMPRSGSDQHLPRVEYSDYTSISQAGRHSLLRSSLKSGSTLSRYNQRYAGQPELVQSKYGPSAVGHSQYASSTLNRRNRPSLDYSSDTEATCGPRSSYYYYRNQSSVPHSTIPTLARTGTLTSADITTKFNSLPRDARGSSTRLQMKRFADRTGVSLLQDDSDGALSAPEMPTIRRDRDEYRSWLSRTPSTSAIYEQIRASRDVLNQQRAARFTYSAENIHDALKQQESYYSAYSSRPGVTSTLDRHFTTRSHHPSIPSRSLSSQHITSSSGLGSSRSPSMRRMRNLLELEQSRLSSAGLPSPGPVPTPSATLPRTHTRQIDINPAEFLKYKLDKPVGSSPSTSGLAALTSVGQGAIVQMGREHGVSGMLWVHLLAGRGLRAPTAGSAATTPVTPSGQPPSIGTTGLRDLYCVLECDRVHKARTVVRTGDLVFDWDESFELDLVNNKELDLLIYSWDPQYRHKLCYKGSVHLASLLRSSPLHQLALKIEPRGTLYLRLRHTDSHQLYRRRGLPSLTLSRNANPPLFGVDLDTVVQREAKTGGLPGGVATGLAFANTLQVPIIIKRCVEEIERRGLDIIGLYRLCGSATKKRILREAFERNSRSVDLTPDNVPDINVITGVLKDYLRELPEPLFTKCLYQMMVDALGVCLPDDPEGNAKLMFSILDCLPRVNRATLIFLMDHLALVVSNSDRNKMSAQNLATALAPPLMLHSTSETTPSAGPLHHHELDYEQPIAVLKYLLQIWPAPKTNQSGRRARPVVPRGDTRSVLQAAGQVSASPSVSSLRGPLQPSVAQSPVVPRSAPLATRALSQAQVQSLQTPGQSSASKGPYRPLSPRVGPICQPAVPKSRQVIVSSPGSPSSSSGDSQSGSDTIKHNVPSRVSSPNPHQSPSLTSLSRASPRASPSVGRASPSIGRASPSIGSVGGRSQSPAMQASSAGLAVTLNGPSTLSALQTTITNINTTANTIFMSTNYSQPPSMIYASTNPFLTGAYLHEEPFEVATKYNTIGGSKSDVQKYTGYDVYDTSKYNTLSTKTTGYAMSRIEEPVYSCASNEPTKYNTLGHSAKYTSAAQAYQTSSTSAQSYQTSGSPNGRSSSQYTSSAQPYQSSVSPNGRGGAQYASSTQAYQPSGSPNGRSGGQYTSSAQSYQSSSSPNGRSGGQYTSSVQAYQSSSSPNGRGASQYTGSYSGTNQYTAGVNLSNGNKQYYGSTTTTTESGGLSVSQAGSLLGVEETPTPTSSIETEDSNTREVGEKDVEGDAEQSD